MELRNERNAAMDNLRAFLIGLVVFAHLLEKVRINPDVVRTFLYFGIYSFHMPVFVFLSGYFAKFSWKRLLRLVLLYVLFQTLYHVFDAAVFGESISLQYTTPYWILWYLMVLIYYTTLIPLLNQISGWGRGLMVVGTVILSLLVGYSERIGYLLSLSRFFVFLPYFVIGYWSGQHKPEMEKLLVQRPWMWSLFGIGAMMLTAWLFNWFNVEVKMLYGSYPYSVGYSSGIRLLVFVIGCGWTASLLALFYAGLNKSIPFLTALGKHTLPIFLLHGFAIKWMDARQMISNSILFCLICTVILLGLLGNVHVAKCFNSLFGFSRLKPALKN